MSKQAKGSVGAHGIFGAKPGTNKTGSRQTPRPVEPINGGIKPAKRPK